MYTSPGDSRALAIERLQGCLQQLESLKDICRVPSITVGVIHEGKVIFKHCLGYRDVESKFRANSDTIYDIASCSKMFTSAALGILVESGRIQWQDHIRDYLPDFNPNGDPEIAKNADFIDFSRHTTGLTDPTGLLLGMDNSILCHETDTVALLNLMDTSDQNGQRFNRSWEYNNFGSGLTALALEKVTGQRYADFLRTELLEPLGMKRTIINHEDLQKDDNVAWNYTTHEHDLGQFLRLPRGDWPCEHHTPLLAATGMCSSLNDMLSWCISVLDAEGKETSVVVDQENVVHDHKVNSNPLKQMTRVRRGYWTRPVDDPDFSKVAAYGMGWLTVELPSSMLGSMSGNFKSRAKEYQAHLQYILGKEAQRRFPTVFHTGGSMGSICSVFTFPTTQSAVVTMTNGRGLGDASDFAAQLIIQALYDLRPAVDLLSWARLEARLSAKHTKEEIIGEWIKNRRIKDPRRNTAIYVGRYQGFEGHFVLEVSLEQGMNDQIPTLSLVFNDCPQSRLPLIFYKSDVYSFADPEKDCRVRVRGRPYESVLLSFTLDDSAHVRGLHWKWNIDAEPAWFELIDSKP